MPNMDPRAIKNIMDKMGIKSKEVDAEEVLIKCKEVTIRITEPSVMQITAQGSISFQISGTISQFDNIKIEVSEDDIKMVMDNTGVSDGNLIRRILDETHGDIAEAIIRLKKQ